MTAIRSALSDGSRGRTSSAVRPETAIAARSAAVPDRAAASASAVVGQRAEKTNRPASRAPPPSERGERQQRKRHRADAPRQRDSQHRGKQPADAPDQLLVYRTARQRRPARSPILGYVATNWHYRVLRNQATRGSHPLVHTTNSSSPIRSPGVRRIDHAHVRSWRPDGIAAISEPRPWFWRISPFAVRMSFALGNRRVSVARYASDARGVSGFVRQEQSVVAGVRFTRTPLLELELRSGLISAGPV